MKTVIMNIICSVYSFVKAHTVVSIVTAATVMSTSIAIPIAMHVFHEKQDSTPEVSRRGDSELAEQEAIVKEEAKAQTKADSETHAKLEAEKKIKEDANSVVKAEAEKKTQKETSKQEVKKNTQEIAKNESYPCEKSEISSNPTTPKNTDEKQSSFTTPEDKASAETFSTITAEKFSEAISVYEYKNIEPVAGSGDYVAWMSVYCVNDNVENKTAFKNKFESVFGFMPTSEIHSKYIGEFLVDGYEGTQKVCQYTIEDSTYPLITDEFYVVKKKICADGSGWCGFPIPCSMDNMDNSQRVQNLLLEMQQMFCEWYGVDYTYVKSNRDKFMVNMISEAGRMRTEEGRVVDVIYRYIRGINMPI